MEKRWRICLWVMLAVAAYVRVSHASVGLPYLFRWDEPLVVKSGLWALAHGWDPFTFRYGGLPIYLSALASALAYFVEMASGMVASFAQFVDVGPPLSNVVGQTTNAPLAFWYTRVLFVLISVSGIGLTCAAARRAGVSSRAALLAALVLAVSPTHQRATLLATVDGIGMTLVAATLLASLWLLQRDAYSRRAIVIAGLTSGLAIATKFALVWTPLVPLAALALNPRDRRAVWTDAALLVAVVTGAFVFSQPYTLLNPDRFLAGVGFEVSHYAFLGHPGQGDSIAGFAQWAQVRKAMGLAFGPQWLSVMVLILSAVGAVVSLRRQWRVGVLLLGWVGWQVFVLSQQVVFFERSLLPMLPAVVMLASFGVDALPALGRHAALVVTGLIFAAFLPLGFAQLGEARDAWHVKDTRSLAAEWLIAHVKPGEDVVISNQLPFDLTELRRHRIATRVVDPVAMPCWYMSDPYTYYVTSSELGPFSDAPVLVNFDGRAVTTDEPLFSPLVRIHNRTPTPCEVPPSSAVTDWKVITPEIGGSGYDPSPKYTGADYVLLGYDGWVKFPNMPVGAGPLRVQVEARATKDASVPAYALVKVKRADTQELVGWHFMPLTTLKASREITFRVPAGEYFVLVSQPYELEHGPTEPYRVELSAVRVHHQVK